MDPVERCLSDSKIEKSQIHEIVLVGGSTRIPKLQKLISDFFDGKELNRSINFDESAAYGAAIQAAILSEDKHKSLKNFMLLDVTPFSLGIKVNDGIMIKIIPRNTTIPIKACEIFEFNGDRKKDIDIEVIF